jgi:hypothetical protein
MTATNITLLGVVGDAAGMLLRKVACAEPDCADAVRMKESKIALNINEKSRTKLAELMENSNS